MKTRTIARALLTGAVSGMLYIAPTSLEAQGASATMPAARDIIARWAKESNAGGWKGHKSAKSTATFDIPAMALSARMETFQTFEPAMSKSRIEIPGLGEMWQGFDGSVVWSVNPMAGPQVLSAEQSAGMKEDSDPSNYTRMSAAIANSETVEKTRMNEQECYKIKHTWKSGRVSHDCFSVTDGMLIWSQSKVMGMMGEAETTTNFSAYKDFGGIKRAVTTTVDQGGQQFVITLNSFEWDTVQAKDMELPAEIKAMVEKKP